MDSIKLIVIGGGSSYTPELADGIIKRIHSFPVRELVLVDIPDGLDKVHIIEELVKRMFHRAGLDIKVWSTTDRRQALKDADFVISQFRAGGLDARSKDEKIPLKHGLIGQETTGAGGFANALRTIPIALEICHDMEEICPEAWLINFTNPSGIVAEAINRYSKVKCIGLCNVPINMVHEVSKNLNCDPERVDCRFAGLNHLSFIGRLYVDGKDILADQKGFDLIQGSVVKNIGGSDISAEYVKALGFIPSPYLKYFYLSKMMLKEESESYQKNGTTRADEVISVETVLFEKYKDEGTDEKPVELTKRGGSLYSEAAISLMSSIYNDSGDIQVVNVMNRGSIPELSGDAVIETNCIIDRKGATPLEYGPLPASIAGLVYQVKAYERLTIEAAIEGSIEKAILALVNNPLVGDIDTAGELVIEIIAAHPDYLGYFKTGGSVKINFHTVNLCSRPNIQTLAVGAGSVENKDLAYNEFRQPVQETRRVYLAGIDGGASKTHCVIGDMQGNLLSEGFSTGSNYQVQGEEAAKTAIKAALNQAMKALDIELKDINYIVLGLAGADMEMDYQVLKGLCATFLPEGKYKILNDTWIGLRANIENNCGIVSICGTGAACAGRNAKGEEIILRNLDYEMGNYGGGGEVARMALHYAFRSEELTERYTRLEKEIPKVFGVANLDQVTLELRAPDFNERRLYEIPILVGKLALQGDVICQEILMKMGQEIGKIASGLIKKLGMEQEHFKVTLVGSVFRSECPLLIDEYTTTVHRTAPYASISIGEQKPVLGAYYLALEEAQKHLRDGKGSYKEAYDADLSNC